MTHLRDTGVDSTDVEGQLYLVNFENSLICFNGVLMCLWLTDTTLSLDSQIQTACHPAANHGLA